MSMTRSRLSRFSLFPAALGVLALGPVRLAAGHELAQQAYLKASNASLSDLFGLGVAVSGDLVAIGAPSEDNDATGVNGNQQGGYLTSSGAVYVYVPLPPGTPGGSSWQQQAYIKSSNPAESHRFGSSIAISGDTMVVGALGESSHATGVNGDQTDTTAHQAGAAYVFVRTGETWTQEAYLKASNTDPSLWYGDRFGESVDIDGDTIVVGAPHEDSRMPGVDPPPTGYAYNSGAAYVFVRSGGTWQQQAFLKASNPVKSAEFGQSVGVSGDTVVVGAYGENNAATGVDGDQNAGLAPGSGAAYVFERDGTTWSQQAYLKATNTDPDDNFGVAVDVEGDTVAVGAIGESSSAIGVNGNGSLNDTEKAGAAYVFVRQGTSWSRQAYIKASNTFRHSRFGSAIALSGERLLVGANGEGGGASGVNGDESLPRRGGSGAAYLFERDGTAWSQTDYIKASNPDESDSFGVAIGMSGERIVAGGQHEESGAQQVDGEQGNDTGGAGAAYLFDRTPIASPYCAGTTCPCGNDDPAAGCANATGGGARLVASGTRVLAYDDLTLTVTQLPPNVSGLVFLGPNEIGVPFGDGRMCIGGGLRRYQPVLSSGSAGTFSVGPGLAAYGAAHFSPSHQMIPSTTWSFQAWYRDPNGPCGTGFNLSNAVRASF